jgi:endonuclease/exonuclease/phosphatase family metal-dependent hydrolase
MVLRVLTWNLLHGRSIPPSGRDLFEEFCAALAGWEWDVALLQEVPPWWPAVLAERLQADQRLVLTSRNALLPVRRAVAERWPDLIKSNGGGANAILVRGERISAHHRRRLSVWPERRWVHAVRLERSGVWVGNVHGGGPFRDAARAADVMLTWVGPDTPAVLGGDFNIRHPILDGFEYAGGYSVDHVLARGLAPVGQAEVLERGRLSDHAPVLVTIAGERAPEPPQRPLT